MYASPAGGGGPGFAMSPSVIMGRQTAPMGGLNYKNPNSLLNAMMGVTPDVNQSWNASSSGISGWGGGGGGGGGFGSGGFGEGSRGISFGGGSAGQSFGTHGQGEKISGLAGAASAAVNQAGRQSRYDTSLPLLQGAMASGVAGMGQSSGAPGITTGPIWSPQQIKQQVNTMKGNSDQSTGTQIRDTQGQLAGRGFGSQSPLLAALTGQAQMANMANKSGQQQGIEWNSAQGNAQHLLASETARANVWNQKEQQDIARRQLAQSGRNAFMAALSGMT